MVHSVSMADTLRRFVIRVEVHHRRRTRLRLWLFGLLIRAAVLVCPAQVDLIDVTTHDTI